MIIFPLSLVFTKISNPNCFINGSWLWTSLSSWTGFSGGSVVKNLLQCRKKGSIPRKDLLEESMATHSTILAWRSHGQNSLLGYSSWSPKSQTQLKWLSAHTHAHSILDILLCSLNCGVGEDSWESLEQQGDQTNQF